MYYLSSDFWVWILFFKYRISLYTYDCIEFISLCFWNNNFIISTAIKNFKLIKLKKKYILTFRKVTYRFSHLIWAVKLLILALLLYDCYFINNAQFYSNYYGYLHLCCCNPKVRKGKHERFFIIYFNYSPFWR